MKDIIKANGFKIRQIIKNFTGKYDEDLEQEVYIRTYQNLEKYQEQNKFSKWISKIAANICRDYLRSAAFRHSSITDSSEDVLNNERSKSNPEREYSLKERQKITLSAINSLPKKLKEALILYEFEDYSYEQIAKKLNVPVGTVKSRINNARKILKVKLSFLLDEDE